MYYNRSIEEDIQRSLPIISYCSTLCIKVRDKVDILLYLVWRQVYML